MCVYVCVSTLSLHIFVFLPCYSAKIAQRYFHLTEKHCGFLETERESAHKHERRARFHPVKPLLIGFCVNEMERDACSLGCSCPTVCLSVASVSYKSPGWREYVFIISLASLWGLHYFLLSSHIFDEVVDPKPSYKGRNN